jgi:SAM-dependent methyltransferase
MCTRCGKRYGGPSQDFLDLRPHETFEERTKYLDEALHADARHERVSPPLLGSRSATTCCAHSSRPARAIGVDLGCGSGRALLWNRDWQAQAVGIDISPFFAAESRQQVDLLLGDLRRLPFADGTFTQGILARRPRTSLARRAARHADRAARVIAPAAELFVYTHVRKNARIAAGLRWINALARAAASAWADRHAPGTPAQVGSPEPARRHPGAAPRRRRHRLPHQAHPLLHAARRRLRREHSHAAR